MFIKVLHVCWANISSGDEKNMKMGFYILPHLDDTFEQEEERSKRRSMFVLFSMQRVENLIISSSVFPLSLLYESPKLTFTGVILLF